jgi:hypothetical protein
MHACDTSARPPLKHLEITHMMPIFISLGVYGPEDSFNSLTTQQPAACFLVLLASCSGLASIVYIKKKHTSHLYQTPVLGSHSSSWGPWLPQGCGGLRLKKSSHSTLKRALFFEMGSHVPSQRGILWPTLIQRPN